MTCYLNWRSADLKGAISHSLYTKKANTQSQSGQNPSPGNVNNFNNSCPKNRKRLKCKNTRYNQNTIIRVKEEISKEQYQELKSFSCGSLQLFNTSIQCINFKQVQNILTTNIFTTKTTMKDSEGVMSSKFKKLE